MTYSMANKMPEDKLIRKYLGIPYKNMGRDMDALDCWGLVKRIFEDHGVEVVDLDNYDQRWARRGENHFLENYSRLWRPVEEPGYLDGLLIRNAHGIPAHAGVYLSNGRFIHCAVRVGVVVAELNEFWKPRIEGIFRYDKNNLYS